MSTAGELLGAKDHNDSVALDADYVDKTEYSDDDDDFSGKSRSSTIALAFLIQKTSLTLEEAIVQVNVIINFSTIVIVALIIMIYHYRCHNISLSIVIQVKSARTINPNLGFLTALIQLEESLASKKN